MNVIQTILDYNKSKESGGKTDITKSDIISALGYTPISELEKGANSGIAELDDNGKVLTSELPSYVDDVEEFNNLVELQKHTGEASKIYITLDDNKCYRWGGTAYVEISSSITLGETSGTAFRGDLGKEAYDKSHTHSNKEVIDSITSEDITNWNNKSDFDGKYTSLTDTPTIPTVTNDLTNELKANYDLASTQTHTHSNKELLDKLSLNKDNKLLYNGDKVDSDVDLTAIIDDSTITDKTTWSSNKINTTIPKTWVGTKADYEQIKDTLENGTIVYITDDESVILLDKTEITKMKLTDEEFKRQINTLYDINNGSALSIETDSDTAYQKAVPTGAKLMSVKNVGGRSIVFNQIFETDSDTNNGVIVTVDSDGTITLNGTTTLPYINFRKVTPEQDKIGKYAFKLLILNNPDSISMTFGFLNRSQPTPAITSGSSAVIYNQTQSEISKGKATGISGFAVGTVFNNVKIKIQIFDLTLMFGSGNEPTTVEEFEKMFPADYYPYNAGEIVSAGTESVAVQGRNLFDYTDKIYHGANVNKVENGVIYTKVLLSTVLNIPTIVGNKYTLSFKIKSATANQDGLRWSLQKGKNTSYAYDSSLIKSEVGFTANTEYQAVVTFVADTDFVSLCTIMTMVYDVQLEVGDTATDYSPYHQTGYPIPEAIRNLPGYGWSAGTARNYVDYENKKYYQCVEQITAENMNLYKNDDTTSMYFSRSVKAVSGTPGNVICNILPTSITPFPYLRGCTISRQLPNMPGILYLNVGDSAENNVASVKKYLIDNNAIFYYELATPIVTDISNLIPDGFLRSIEVEAGGSITFKNSNGDSYRIPVPSELSYTVKFNSNASKEYVDSELAKKANKTDIPTKLPANGGNADTVNNHTVLSDVPASAKFTDTITPIEDSSTTSTTSTWSAQKINDTITSNKNARVILSIGRDIVEAETKTAELVSLDGAYLYWSSQAGTNNYVFGIILYVYNKWTMIPIAQSSDDASTGITFSITDNTLTMTRRGTISPTAGGVFALGPTLI